VYFFFPSQFHTVRKDWKRHKPFCKGNFTAQQKPLTSTTSVNDAHSIVERNHGKELTIEVPGPGRPGEKMKIASTTLPPATMKMLRNNFEKTSH
jgi:hypothetical protein